MISMKRFAKIFKNKRAQQLVEFLLVAPFLVIIFGILTEYAYALSINLTLNQGLKTVTSSIYSEIAPGITADQINSLVLSDLKNYMLANRIPVGSENNLNVEYATVEEAATSDGDAVFLANYTYIPAFTLPIVYVHFLPDKFNFSTAVVVPAAFLKPNNYPKTDKFYANEITSDMLDNFWGNVGDFSTLDSFETLKRGLMKTNVLATLGDNEAQAGAKKTLFLVNPIVQSGGKKFYEILDFKGDSIAGAVLGFPNYHLYIDLDDRTLYVFDLLNNFVYTSGAGINFSILPSTYTNLMIMDDPVSDPTWNSSWWTTNCVWDIPLYVKTQSCMLKDAVALSTDYGNVGNYDNLDISSYGPLFVSSSKYKVETFGPMVVVHDATKVSTSTINNLTNGLTVTPLPDDAFGKRVTVIP